MEPFSKLRQQAESAFSKTQTQASARQRVFDELDSVAAARQEKSARLREARLARDVSAAAEAPAPTEPKKTQRHR